MTAQQQYNYNSPVKPSTTGSSSITSPSRSRLDPQYAARLHRSSPNHKQRSPMHLVHRHSNSLSPARSVASSGSPASSSYVYSDRYIPSRCTSQLDNYIDIYDENCAVNKYGASVDCTFHGDTLNDPSLGGSEPQSPPQVALPNDTATTTGTGDQASGNSVSEHNTLLSHQPMIGALLRSELFGENISTAILDSPNASLQNSRSSISSQPSMTRRNRQGCLQQKSYQFRSPRYGTISTRSILKTFNLNSNSNAENYIVNLSQQRRRKIAKVPFKVLDAPALEDDFYLNLVDWSSQNILAVGLGSCVYLWSACTSKVTKLCDLAANDDHVSSVSWTQRGTHLAVGTNRGEVQLWDTVKCSIVRILHGHTARVGTLGWSGPMLASGSRDRSIYLHDARIQQNFAAKLMSHKQEVCGLKWSFDEPAHLASGGNDNNLLVWDIKKHSQPLHKFEEHKAAIKAIAWSPHQHGLLASGGGTADRRIRFWNTVSGVCLDSIDTGSQVCNLAWSKNCNELVSTHGYSLNQIVVWKYPTMEKVATLTGHTYRVLYLSMSPDGSTVCTGAGDETIRFWQIFPGPRSCDKNTGSGLLFPSMPGSVIR